VECKVKGILQVRCLRLSAIMLCGRLTQGLPLAVVPCVVVASVHYLVAGHDSHLGLQGYCRSFKGVQRRARCMP
jgi:hypothetical protein